MWKKGKPTFFCKKCGFTFFGDTKAQTRKAKQLHRESRCSLVTWKHGHQARMDLQQYLTDNE